MPRAVVEPQLVDVDELARNLLAATANLKQYIAAEAQRRAAELGKTYAKAADERIRDNATDFQRAQDLVAELRRQMKPLERSADRGQRLALAVRQARYAGREHIAVDELLAIINAPATAADGEHPEGD